MKEALYRKYRPRDFGELVGQDHVQKTLINALEQDKVSHAYLFCGSRGTGKTTTARVLAKALLCKNAKGAHPCGECEDCQSIATGNHPDVYELDAASRTGVENVREEIINRVSYAPTKSAYKVYIIDEVHMLSTAAFNALLKTLEEPPAHVIFILCTTDPQKVPETIQSRCQRFDFKRISDEDIIMRLYEVCAAEGIKSPQRSALELIASRAEGGMRNALTALEQVIAFGQGSITEEAARIVLGMSRASAGISDIIKAIASRDMGACFAWVEQKALEGIDYLSACRLITKTFRDMLVLKFDEKSAIDDEVCALSKLFGTERLINALCVLDASATDLKNALNPRISFEIALVKLCRPESSLTLESLSERIEALEQKAQSTPEPVASPKEVSAKPTPVKEVPVVKEAPKPKSVETPSTFGALVENPTPAQNYIDALSNEMRLHRLWSQTQVNIKKANPSIHALYLNIKTAFDAKENAVVIIFPSQNDFAYNRAIKEDAVALVSDCLNKAAGVALSLRITKEDLYTPSANPSVDDDANKASDWEEDIIEEEYTSPQKADDVDDGMKALMAGFEGIRFEEVDE
ncbi:MAG: DNA polymerase III subunit gamma/tau [Eggerthellaceae bacterium]|nr:DNA polymerase III subunit gamma/tau [Eggerthellaceae bacterium]